MKKIGLQKKCSNEEEKYWIEYYNSYEEGYNSTIGWRREIVPRKGEKNNLAILTPKKNVIQIRNAYKNNRPKIEFYRKYFSNRKLVLARF